MELSLSRLRERETDGRTLLLTLLAELRTVAKTAITFGPVFRREYVAKTVKSHLSEIPVCSAIRGSPLGGLERVANPGKSCGFVRTILGFLSPSLDLPSLSKQAS